MTRDWGLDGAVPGHVLRLCESLRNDQRALQRLAPALLDRCASPALVLALARTPVHVGFARDVLLPFARQHAGEVYVGQGRLKLVIQQVNRVAHIFFFFFVCV
jgi:hypothetical protein